MPEELKQQVAELAGRVETLVEMTQTVHTTTIESGQRLKGLETNQRHTLRTVRGLNKAIYQGNGQPAIMQRLTVLENTLDRVVKDVKAAIDDLESVKNGKMLSRTQIVAGAIGMFLAALSGVGAIIAAFIK